MKKLSLAAIVGAIGAAGLVALGQTTAIAQADDDPALLAALIAEGGPLYNQYCAVCHLAGGEGGGGGAPRLAPGPAGPNPFMVSGRSVTERIIGGYMEHGMPPFAFLSDREVSAIATYVRNAWGNEFGLVTEATAAAVRAELAEGGGE